jgi:hypothetical protein
VLQPTGVKTLKCQNFHQLNKALVVDRAYSAPRIPSLPVSRTRPAAWLVADGWCWFLLREEHCWLIAGGWFGVREKYCWLVADKKEHGADPTEAAAGPGAPWPARATCSGRPSAGLACTSSCALAWRTHGHGAHTELIRTDEHWQRHACARMEEGYSPLARSVARGH